MIETIVSPGKFTGFNINTLTDPYFKIGCSMHSIELMHRVLGIPLVVNSKTVAMDSDKADQGEFILDDLFRILTSHRWDVLDESPDDSNIQIMVAQCCAALIIGKHYMGPRAMIDLMWEHSEVETTVTESTPSAKRQRLNK